MQIHKSVGSSHLPAKGRCISRPILKGLFKPRPPPPTPADLVRQLRDLLIYADRNTEPKEAKRREKMCELNKLILEARTALYGNDHSEPVAEICAQLTQEFFRDNMLRLLILCLPKLDSGARQDAARVVKNLHGQRVNSRLVASDYMEENADLVDILVPGYEDSDTALSYGAILRDCIRHQIVARYLLESEHVKKFFDYMQNPNFEIASDAAATFKEVLTRHKSTVADFLLRNYQTFFQEYNSRLLESPNYITRRHAVKLLGEILTDRSNSSVMVHYVSSLDNMRVLMNLLRDSNKTIQLDAFQVFKLFIDNQNKPPEIVSILVQNRSKLLQFFGDFKLGKKDEAFEADKAQVVKDIALL
ncbi:putative MO25-like protein At5g47540 [Rhododendron vialii]|uniref:putative MO25-like protein At5g47540 n=1 Tax=Rhododendron vialii TaxID=182163 RepID=UPI00265DAD62|nr:putative MO25-like protein At5g47540 [Rhododendron vialii]